MVIGIWDDHDYGINDGDRTFRDKEQNREIFLEFIGEPKTSDRWLQKDKGIYQDYLIHDSNVSVHIILLDLRFDADKYSGDRLGLD